MPHSMDMFATIIVSFSCAMQVQAFRKVNGYSYASTMCIGNLRSGTDALSVFVRTGNKASLRKSGYYFGIILFFAIGAGIGGNLSMMFGIHTIWISSALLLISVLLMFAEKLKCNVRFIQSYLYSISLRSWFLLPPFKYMAL